MSLRVLLGGLLEGSLKNACDYRFGSGSNSEDLPIMLRLIEPASDSMGRGAVHEIVIAVMRETADRLRKQALELAGMAAQIERAATHWLRRTAGIHQSDGIDLKIVRDTLGQAHIATNNIYLRSEDYARHGATSARHRVGCSARVIQLTATNFTKTQKRPLPLV